ncbi:MAG: hypothetical protein JST10_05795 [Bacteroidetes bacterium]|nr:hypothetical protein [Bacteroidota bacterium]MBS1632069.1 hypothetical protein [Bacteroidota bacterium]
MYEHKRKPLAPMHIFYKRVLKNIFLSFEIILVCLVIGVLGYHYSADIPWLDSFHNSSMILAGMGPVVEVKTTIGKWFSSLYALFAGVIFITNIGIILAPVAHRLIHRLNLED